MLRVRCPRHGTDVLLTEHEIVRLRNTPLGPELDWRCTCGATGTWEAWRRSRRSR